jgi:CheY-like chemotaxis protein
MTARILVIEDNPDNRTLLIDLLTSLSYEVLEGADGNEGVEKAISEKPDLILMDLSLPQKDGWQATKEIKANPETKDIPVIALTAHAMVGDKKRALDAGCNDYVSKPIDMMELIKKVQEHINKNDM